MKTVKVISYNETQNFHTCADEDGKLIHLDLMVCSCLPENITHEDLVGKSVRYDYHHPYVSIAEGVELIP